MKIKIILIFFMTLVLLSPYLMLVRGDGPNYMGFTEPVKHVTVGDYFYSYIYGDIHSEIDTIAVDNLTYQPAGILNNVLLTTPQSKGNIFNDSYTLIFTRPTEKHDDEGWVKPWLWAIDAPGSTPRVNNTNATAFNTKWLAVKCGVATLTITEGGTAAGGNDPGTTKFPQVVYVHPVPPSSFTATAYNLTQINLTWTKGTGADKTVIRYSNVSYPSTPTSGYSLYNGTDNSTVHSGLNPSERIYYSAWSWNETAGLFSLLSQNTTSKTSSPPVFGSPTPSNNSINRPIAFTWSIPISDPDGDRFNWSIECSNGQRNSAVNAQNGTKSLSLSGLSFNTTYTVWVNATDGASWTREWYNFTTKVNSPPDVPIPYPENNTVNVPPGHRTLEVLVTDPDGTPMNVSFYWGNGTLIGVDTLVSNNSIASIQVLLEEYTTYTWYVNVSDGYGGSTRGPPTGNWTFTTGKALGGTPPESHYLVTISVVHDNKPLPHALILIYKGVGTQAVVATTSTSQDGVKKLYLPAGTYTIHVSYPRLQEQTKTITVTGNTVVSFILEKPTIHDYSIILISIILLAVAFLLIWFAKASKLLFGLTITNTLILALLLNIIAFIIGLFYFWWIAIASVVLIIVEMLWMKIR